MTADELEQKIKSYDPHCNWILISDCLRREGIVVTEPKVMEWWMVINTQYNRFVTSAATQEQAEKYAIEYERDLGSTYKAVLFHNADLCAKASFKLVDVVISNSNQLQKLEKRWEALKELFKHKVKGWQFPAQYLLDSMDSLEKDGE